MNDQITQDSQQETKAAAEARRKIAANPHDAEAYRALGRALRSLGETESANEAELAAIEASDHDPNIRNASEAMVRNDLPLAEQILRSVLSQRPGDVAAIRMLAEIALHSGYPRDADVLLRRAIELAPGFFYSHYTRAVALDMLSRSGEALEELNCINGPEAELDSIIGQKALALSRVGENDEAIGLCRKLLERQADNPEIWISLANLLKIVGDSQGAIDAYREVLKVAPCNGEAWWSLANLKTYRFSDEELTRMETSLETPELNEGDRFRLHFALGKAFEDRGQYEASFEHYQRGNNLRGAQIKYRPDELAALVGRTEQLFTAEFFEQRSNFGCEARDPIFIIGMPRSGSTLIEQILASHPMVEGTGELPDVIVLARELEETSAGGALQGWVNYPALLSDLSAKDLKRLGETYLKRTRIQRKSDRPFFTDKMPNNWIHVGLIHLMFPNAKIIDSRRHALACGFSNYKQHYARGQEFSYDLEHFGRYYREYVRLMDHFEKVRPGIVHRLVHEQLLADPEAEIRRLLAYLGLPFDENCLNFNETKRAVRTASAEQVRQPIDAEGADHWKEFERWLGPLKSALGYAE